MDKNKNNTVLIIVLSIVLIFIFILIIFRTKIFGRNNSDFGVYETPITTNCITPSGLCTDKGTNYSISKCIPNNGKGCLNSKGQQTFETIIKQQSCIPQCISSLWNINSTSQCLPDIVKSTPFGDCTPNGISGINIINQTCVKNDEGGINTCTVVLKPNDILPSWTGLCILNNTKTLATCPIGTNITLQQTCIPSSLTYKTCGVWGIDGGKDICNRSQTISRSNVCYSLTDTTVSGGRVLLNKITDTYNFGWTSSFPPNDDIVPPYNLMTCVNFISPDGNVSTSNIGCPYPSDVISNISDIKTYFVNNSNGAVSNINDFTTPQVECIQPCSFYDPVAIVNGPSRFQTWMKNIIMYPFFIKNSTGDRYITLNNIPCSGNPLDSLTQGTIIQYEPFSDCYGNPDTQLDISSARLYKPQLLADNNSSYGINGYYTNNKTTFNQCGVEDIKLTNNTIFLFNPIESVDMFTSFFTTRKVLKGVLVGIQNNNYTGSFVSNSANLFEWRQINDSNFKQCSKPRYSTTCYITLWKLMDNNVGTLNNINNNLQSNRNINNGNNNRDFTLTQQDYASNNKNNNNNFNLLNIENISPMYYIHR